MAVEGNEVAREEVRQVDVGGNEEERPKRFGLVLCDVTLRRKGAAPDERGAALRPVWRDVSVSVPPVEQNKVEVEAASVKQGEEKEDGDGTMEAG